MVLIDSKKMKRDFVRRHPFKRDLIEVRTMGSGLTLFGSGFSTISELMGGQLPIDDKLKLIKKMGKKSNFAIMKGRGMMTPAMKKNKKLVEMGMLLSDPSVLSGGRVIVPIVGNGFFDTVKQLGEKGVKKAKQIGKDIKKSGEKVVKDIKKKGEKFIGDTALTLTDLADSKALQLDKKIDKLGKKASKEIQRGEEFALVLGGDKKREIDKLVDKGFSADILGQMSGLKGSGMRGGNTARNKGIQKVRGISGFRDDLNKGQERFLDNLDMNRPDLPTPVFGRDQVTELNDLILSTPIPTLSKQKSGGRMNMKKIKKPMTNKPIRDRKYIGRGLTLL